MHHTDQLSAIVVRAVGVREFAEGSRNMDEGLGVDSVLVGRILAAIVIAASLAFSIRFAVVERVEWWSVL